MKVLYVGANCRTGVSEKTGRAYTIAEVSYLIPDSNARKDTPDGKPIWNYVGFGSAVRSIALDPSKISAFAGIET